MGWVNAARLAIRPALLVGPAVGLLGSVLTTFVASLFQGPWVFLGFYFVIALMVGLILGLLIATPTALVCGSIMLRLGAVDVRWMQRRAWAAVGASAGGAIGFALGVWTQDIEGLIVGSLFGAALGLVAALLFRRMLASSIDQGAEVDTDIFS